MCLQAVLKPVKSYVIVKHVQNIKIITGKYYICGMQRLWDSKTWRNAIVGYSLKVYPVGGIRFTNNLNGWRDASVYILVIVLIKISMHSKILFDFDKVAALNTFKQKYRR